MPRVDCPGRFANKICNFQHVKPFINERIHVSSRFSGHELALKNRAPPKSNTEGKEALKKYQVSAC